MNTSSFNNRLYGRTRGRNNKKIKTSDYLKLIEKYKFTKLESNKNYILDIGTGYGETSIFLANKYPDSNIISCDKYIDGNLKLLKEIQSQNIKNINIHPSNVHEILDQNYQNKYFNLVWIFFPDPWPKKKHFKRRLVTSSFLKKIHPFVKKNGQVCIITDSTSYIKFIIKNLYDSKKIFKWNNQNSTHLNLKDYYDLETKFYKKAIISGRKPVLFILKKI